ncbi:MAG: hypothetical protein P8M12_00965 [Flavobacteriales bacterium]|nr:hypothetical protein [Flavobacteriales bacterium]
MKTGIIKEVNDTGSAGKIQELNSNDVLKFTNPSNLRNIALGDQYEFDQVTQIHRGNEVTSNALVRKRPTI